MTVPSVVIVPPSYGCAVALRRSVKAISKRGTRKGFCATLLELPTEMPESLAKRTYDVWCEQLVRQVTVLSDPVVEQQRAYVVWSKQPVRRVTLLLVGDQQFDSWAKTPRTFCKTEHEHISADCSFMAPRIFSGLKELRLLSIGFTHIGRFSNCKASKSLNKKELLAVGSFHTPLYPT